MEIETKKNIIKFYISITLGFIIFIALGSLMINFYFVEVEKNGNNIKPLFFILFGFVVILFPFYTLFRYYKNSPSVKVFDNKIQINREIIHFNEIKIIHLTGKLPFKYIVNFPMEGIYIKLKSNREFFIFDNMYENLWEIKHYLNQYENGTLDKVNSVNTKNISKSSLLYETFKHYKGLPILFTFNGLFMFFFFALGLLILVKNYDSLTIILISCFFFYMSLLGFKSFHTFSISKKYFQVSNFYNYRVNCFYDFTEIKEIVFEQEARSPIKLIVITKNFQSKPFSAASLRKKEWKSLKLEFEKRNISVRVDCTELWDI